MTEFRAETLHAMIKAYVPGFELEQTVNLQGKVNITLHHTMEVAYRPAVDASTFVKEVIRNIDELILSTRPVEGLRAELRKKDAQIEGLMKQLAELQRYADYVAVTKEIAKAGAK